MSDSEKPFDRARAETFDRLIEVVQKRIDAQPVPLVVLTSLEEKPVALREVWGLFANGLRYLKNPEEQHSPLAGALKKVSLRSTAFARNLFVPAPDFEQQVFEYGTRPGDKEALLYSGHLVGAAESDLPKSVAIIRESLEAVESVQNPLLPLKGDMAMRLRALHGNAAAASTVRFEDIGAFQTQTTAYLDLLSDTYKAVCAEFRADLQAAGFRPEKTRKMPPPANNGPAN